MTRLPKQNGRTDTPHQPARVAIVYRMESLGGVQSVVHTLMKGLNKIGIVPDILWDLEPNCEIFEEVGVKGGYRPLDFPVSTHQIDRLPDSVRYLAWAANVIDGSRYLDDYDFFFIFYNGFLLPAEVPHVRYLSGPPLLPQLETFSPGLRGVPARTFRLLYKGVLRHWLPAYEVHRHGNYVINSQYTAGLFEEAHGRPVQVVYPPINVSRFSFADDDWSQRDTLTYFSRVVDYKRPEVVLQLAARHPELRCVIMGRVHPVWQDYFDRLKTMARELGRPDVIFLADAPFQRVEEELARTRYFIFPGRFEHFGMATAEAIAAGTLPFVHDSGGQREVVPDERLRFQDDTLFDRFDSLLALQDTEVQVMRKQLLAHIQQFSEDRFNRTMIGFLHDQLAVEPVLAGQAA